MSEQLKFEHKEELLAMGFEEVIEHETSPYGFDVTHVVTYRRECGANGQLIYNPGVAHPWYHVVKIGSNYNHIQLNIKEYDQLLSIIDAFG